MADATRGTPALGPFDLDPCAADPMPWSTAGTMWTAEDDGRLREWFGRVWLNPPYGPELGDWLRLMAIHGRGMALVFARTETRAFHRHVWPRASALRFIRGRINFYTPDGKRSPQNAGGPSVLIAYGEADAERLATCCIDGAFVDRRGA